MPVSFLEASAYKCAILSSNNPDGFAENFGYHTKDGNYEEGLRLLLQNDRWRESGIKGYEYVKETHELNRVIDRHVEMYKEIVE